MAKSAKTPAAANRAKFARAERLQRQAAERGDAPKQSKARSRAKARPDRTRTPRGDRPAAARRDRPRGEQRRSDRPRTPERERIERRHTASAAAPPRLAYNIAAGRRQQHERRATLDRQRQAMQQSAQRFEAQRNADRKQAEQRQQADQKKHEQARRDQVRTDLAKAADRQKHTRLATLDRQREATRRSAQRFEAQRKADRKQAEQRKQGEQKKQAQQRRDQVRTDLAKAADRRQDHARRVSIQRHTDQARANLQRAATAAAERARAVQARAGASIEQTHKRQRADQQAAHRFETSAMRTRHQGVMQSLRRNGNEALERHHHAVIGIDNREREALADFDARRSSLTGRIAEAVPGRRAANDEARAQLVRGFEAERLHKHRDLEALKVRQFDVAQAARLGQARERLDIARTHQGQRIDLDHRQKAGRGAAVKLEARAIQRVDREQSLQASRVRNDFERERTRSAPGA